MKIMQYNLKKITINLATLKAIDNAIDKVEFYSNSLSVIIQQLKSQREKAQKELCNTEENNLK